MASAAACSRVIETRTLEPSSTSASGSSSSARPNSASGSLLGLGAVDLLGDEDDAVQVLVVADAEGADHEVGLAERLEGELAARGQLARALELGEHPAEKPRQRGHLLPFRP